MNMTDSINPDILKVPEEEFKIDHLQLYFERPIKINSKITIYQPTVGQIVDAGEDEFYSMLYKFIGNTTMFRLSLWKMGIDWHEITDYELFTIFLLTQMDTSLTQLLFKDLDFTQFKARTKIIEDKESYSLYNPIQDVEIDEDTYKNIALGLRTMFGIFPKTEFAANRATKMAMIWEEEQNLQLREKEEHKSLLLPLISSCLNHPGFKYKKTELEDVGIYEFMDAVHRLQIYESTTALLKGMYSGFIDTSKIDKKEFDFMREISKSSK